MSEENSTLDSLEDLGKVKTGVEPGQAEADLPIISEPKIDEMGRSYATGKRKNKSHKEII